VYENAIGKTLTGIGCNFRARDGVMLSKLSCDRARFSGAGVTFYQVRMTSLLRQLNLWAGYSSGAVITRVESPFFIDQIG
jgi:hypothetical protein